MYTTLGPDELEVYPIFPAVYIFPVTPRPPVMVTAPVRLVIEAVVFVAVIVANVSVVGNIVEKIFSCVNVEFGEVKLAKDTVIGETGDVVVFSNCVVENVELKEVELAFVMVVKKGTDVVTDSVVLNRVVEGLVVKIVKFDALFVTKEV